MMSYAVVRPTKVDHLSADFTQVRIQVMLAEEQTMTGHFDYTAPNTINWKYDNGIEAKLPPQMLQFISKAVSGDLLEENADFSVTQSGDVVVLTPKRRQLKQLFKEISIRFNSLTGLAGEVTMIEASDDITVITFRNITTD